MGGCVASISDGGGEKSCSVIKFPIFYFYFMYRFFSFLFFF